MNRLDIITFVGRANDLKELIEWMDKFTFELSWEDIDVKPLEMREEEEEVSVRSVFLNFFLRYLSISFDQTKVVHHSYH